MNTDEKKIAQPFKAGMRMRECEKSRQGRQNISFVPVGTWRFCQTKTHG